MTPHISNALFMAFNCFHADQLAYISTPVTGGIAKIIGFNNHKDYNIAQANKFAEYVKNISDKPVINPACLYISTMQQWEYLDLWKKVIEKVATEIWFNAGWAFSNGCAEEYVFALKLNKLVLDAHGNLLLKKRALKEMQQAICFCRQIDNRLPGVERAFQELNDYNKFD